MSTSRSLSISISIPRLVAERAILWSQRLKEKGGLFVLNEKTCLPHVTLYMTEFPSKNIIKLKKLINQLAAKTKPFELKAIGYRRHQDGFIEIYYKKSKKILGLQKKLLKALNPLRQGLVRESDKLIMNRMTARELKYLSKYGYRSVGPCYSPHLTLSKFKDHKTLTYFPKNTTLFSFTATRIRLAITGPFSTSRKTLAIFDFI